MTCQMKPVKINLVACKTFVIPVDTFSFQKFGDPVVLSGFILIVIGLVLGLIIIFIRRLHSTSTMNSIFIVITMIIISTGFALLISCVRVYEIFISLPLATGFTILAIFMGMKLEDVEEKFKTILFMICLVAAGIGFILFILGLIFKDHVLQGDAWLCWCCSTFIVIIFTIDYLKGHREREQYSEFYIIFVWFYEYFVLSINSEFFLNTLLHCDWKSGKSE
ncbi:unnamed protein product [Schistosoma mattheei]|uniref:DUF4203 domain-containing protein n=1 Tax=Schistosoma mattheei TaxID=31246 RepID=A0AA85ASS2_9TREM|nr:unnamed protein product [Schistosoma mattheei]